MHVTILHTNDIHARIAQLPRISTLAQRIRREVEVAGGHVLLWDAGDSEDRAQFEDNMTKGVTMMARLNAMGYQAAALGNAISLTYGPQAVAPEAEEAHFPILAANFRWADGTPVPGPRPYHIFDLRYADPTRPPVLTAEDAKDAETLDKPLRSLRSLRSENRPGVLRLGVIGATTDFRGMMYRFFGVEAGNPAGVIRSLLPELQRQGVDLIAVLSHIGSEDDQALAQAVPEVAFIIGGHDHKELHEPLLVGRTIIAQAGDYGRYLGRLDLEIDPASKRVVGHRGQLIPVTDDIPPDPAVEAAIETQRVRVQALMAHPVGALVNALDYAHDRECGIGDFLADVIRERMDAEVSLLIMGHVRDGLAAGAVTLGDLSRVCHSTGNPARVQLTGRQITDMLRRALDPAVRDSCPKPMRGHPVGIFQVSGLTYSYDPAGPADDRLREVRVGGQAIDPERAYTVATSDYELSDFAGFVQVDQDQVTYEVPTVMREALEEYLRQHSPVRVAVGGRVLAVRKGTFA